MPVPGNAIITVAEATQIKSRLWDGEDVHEVAKAFKVGVEAVYNIRSGWRWEDAPWPNGATGSMPKSRMKEINKASKTAKRLYTSVVLRESKAANGK